MKKASRLVAPSVSKSCAPPGPFTGLFAEGGIRPGVYARLCRVVGTFPLSSRSVRRPVYGPSRWQGFSQITPRRRVKGVVFHYMELQLPAVWVAPKRHLAIIFRNPQELCPFGVDSGPPVCYKSM